MKKLFIGISIFILMIIFLGASTPNGNPTTRYQTLTLTGNTIAAVEMDSGLVGGCLYAVELKCTADDAVKFSLISAKGSPMYSVTTTDATAAGGTGEFHIVENFFPINDNISYEMADFAGGGTCVVEVTAWQR
jgi:hypothetical protein